LYQDKGAQIVFVIYGFDLDSRSRAKFLATEMDQYPDARFLFLTKNEGSLLLENEFAQQLAAKPYSICDIPFVAIASFVEKNFGLTASEAEVIAFRLHNTFEKFKLLAHPTYFAGIPKETLSALLQANRRSELIQFAVDGFLAFVVAGDQSDISLSLTTRKRFLSQLAIELRVFKRSFSESAVLELAKFFAAEYDFEIDALRFVSTFVDKGILRFENGLVEFTLPFIEHYLLAFALARDEALAKRHFAFDEDDFDFETFDLYCEIGAADSVVKAVQTRLADDIRLLGSENPKPGAMLTDELRPVLVQRYDRIADMRTGFERAIKRLQEKSRDGEEKQRLLDVASKTTKGVSKKAQAEDKSQRKDLHHPNLGKARRDWQIGSVMLGLSAEQLMAATKQELASALISLGSQLVDFQARSRAKVNFIELRSDIMRSAEVDRFLSLFKEEPEKEEMRKLIDSMLDLFEFALLGQPFISTLNYLCEQSRHRVLATSVEKASVDGAQQEMMRSAWLADLDGRKGRATLMNCISTLPPAPFFRIVLASHFLNRVYWTQWKKEDREALLDAAQATVKALGIRVEKGKLMRLIGREDGEKVDQEREVADNGSDITN
jgi:hypothetical protein